MSFQNNTFGNASQSLIQMFGDSLPKSIMVVAVDFAKEGHVVRLIRANGEFFHKHPLSIKNNQAGFNTLLKRIRQTCSTHNIKQEQVVVTLESPHSYAIAFFKAMQSAGYLVVNVDAQKAKMNRNHNSSSDAIDLSGIFTVTANRHAQDFYVQPPIYEGLKSITRSYHVKVKDSTRKKNALYKLMDRIFSKFLTKSQSGLSSFEGASLALLKEGVTPKSLLRRNHTNLVKFLKKYQVKDAENVARKLRKLAEESFASCDELSEYFGEQLRIMAQDYDDTQVTIGRLERSMRKLLVQTPYCLLLSIPGVGLVRASTIAAEYGDPSRLTDCEKMAAYAGIVPLTYQTGGENGKTFTLGLPRKCNRRLKNAFMGAAFDVGKYKHPAGRFDATLNEHALQRHFRKVDQRGGKSGLSTAKKMVRIVHQLVTKKDIYKPEMNELTDLQCGLYFQATFQSLFGYFTKKELKEIPQERNVLLIESRKWQKMLKENYDITLELPI